MSLPQYSRYKDSGVEWLGFIPEHWHVGRLKNSVLSSKGGIWGNEESFDDNDIACVRVADFDRSKLRVALENPTIRNVLQSERNGRILERGDLLLEKSGGGENQLVGCVVMYEHDEQAVCSNFVARLKLEADMVSEYWCYVHFALYALRINYCSINQTSGIQNLDQDKYLNEIVPYPDFSEQSAIATFLDRETAKIDTLISEQEKLITLLAEKRQATISHAVTKGLNPNSPMKDSGVEWLGAVPVHWKMLKLKRISPFITVGIVVNPSEYISEDGLPFIYGGDISEGKISTENSRRISVESSRRQPKTMLEVGDLLTVRVGAPGITAVVTEECAGGNCASVMLIRRGDFESGWLCFAMNSRMVRFQVEVVQYGAAQEQFNIGHAINFWIATPPIEEQLEIEVFLKVETARLEALRSEATRGISLLKERRSALISAAVTGKIDVRQAAQQEQITIQEAA